MDFIQLRRTQIQLNVQTKQTLQGQLLISQSIIILFYEDHVQFWNIKQKKCLYSNMNSKDQNILYWNTPVCINQHSFAFICSFSSPKGPVLKIFNSKQSNRVKQIYQFERQMNFTQLFYFKDSQHICVQVAQQQHKLYLIHISGSVKQIDLNSNDTVQKYNNNSVVIFANEGFKIVNGKSQSKHYYLSEIQIGQITTIKQFDKTTAIIGYKLNGKPNMSMVLLYFLDTQKIDHKQTVEFPIDEILNTQNHWIAMCTTEQKNNSTIKVKVVLSKHKCQIISSQINPNLRVWNPYIPILTVDTSLKNRESSKCYLQTIRLITKPNMFIHLLQKSNLLQEYGNDLVKAVIPNFFQK